MSNQGGLDRFRHGCQRGLMKDVSHASHRFAAEADIPDVPLNNLNDVPDVEKKIVPLPR